MKFVYFGVNHVLIGFAGSPCEPMIYLSVGTVNPRVLLFLGIVTQKGIFVKLRVWLSNSNRIACV